MSSKWFEENVRPISPCVARVKSAQSRYPTKPNKAGTADLRAIVSAISEGKESSAD